MVSLDDTIAAVSTPAGASAGGIVRLSGPASFPILQSLLTEPVGDLGALPPYSSIEAPLRLRPGGPRVPATLYLMRGPRSYTRQDVAEIHTVGSAALLRMVLDALVERGARVAEPGEFTRRAFLSGRIDLAQAEAVLAVIQATTDAELRAAARALRGLPSRQIRRLHGRLLALRARVEASIDFAEHDIELISPRELSRTLSEALADVGRQLAGADAGALPPDGIRVALCGLPNAGKSSLFNALLGRDRALVTPVPGTTRDAIAEPLAIDGIRFRLYDTAGLAPAEGLPIADCRLPIAGFGNRKSKIENHAAAPHTPPAESAGDPVDAEAIARSRGLIAGTQIALVVLNATQPLGDAERALWSEIPAPHKLLILNKSDLPTAIPEGTGQDGISDFGLRIADSSARHSAIPIPQSAILRVSALTGAGIPELKAALAALVRSGRVDASPADLTWNARHRQALRRAREALERALAAAADALGAEFVAADLRDAHDALGAITGQVVAEDLLDIIFAQFCIGK